MGNLLPERGNVFPLEASSRSQQAGRLKGHGFRKSPTGRGHDSPVPILAPLPLDGNAGRIANLDPRRARTGSISAVDTLRHDALGAKPASVGEHHRAVFG